MQTTNLMGCQTTNQTYQRINLPTKPTNQPNLPTYQAKPTNQPETTCLKSTPPGAGQRCEPSAPGGELGPPGRGLCEELRQEASPPDRGTNKNDAGCRFYFGILGRFAFSGVGLNGKQKEHHRIGGVAPKKDTCMTCTTFVWHLLINGTVRASIAPEALLLFAIPEKRDQTEDEGNTVFWSNPLTGWERGQAIRRPMCPQ